MNEINELYVYCEFRSKKNDKCWKLFVEWKKKV